MSAKKLTITDTTGSVKGLSINVRYEKMDREDKPEIEHRVGDIVVKERSVHNGVVLLQGMTRKGMFDDQGKEYSKDEIRHYYEGSEVTEKSQSKSFEIIGYQPVASYTDSYVIDKYYEIFPDDDGFKKDFDREVARKKNLRGMRSLWEYLQSNKVVARAEFNVSSSGFIGSDGYVRAISFANKWGLEIGIFKEEKVFRHLEEEIPARMEQENQKVGSLPIKLKRI